MPPGVVTKQLEPRCPDTGVVGALPPGDCGAPKGSAGPGRDQSTPPDGWRRAGEPHASTGCPPAGAAFAGDAAALPSFK